MKRVEGAEKVAVQKKQPKWVVVDILVGTTGFEPAAFCSQSRRDTKLRYVPDVSDWYRSALSEPTYVMLI